MVTTRSRTKALFEQANTKGKNKQMDSSRLNNIQHFKASRIPVKQDGINLIQAKFKSDGQGFSNEEIELVAARYQQEFLDALEDADYDIEDYEFQMMVSQFYDESIFWQSGKWSKFGANPDFYDYAQQYEFDGEPLQGQFKRFNLIIKQIKK